MSPYCVSIESVIFLEKRMKKVFLYFFLQLYDIETGEMSREYTNYVFWFEVMFYTNEDFWEFYATFLKGPLQFFVTSTRTYHVQKNYTHSLFKNEKYWGPSNRSFREISKKWKSWLIIISIFYLYSQKTKAFKRKQ